MGERDFAGLDEGGRGALRGRSRIPVAGWVAVGVEGGGDGLGRETVELARQDRAAVEALREVEAVPLARLGAIGAGQIAEVRDRGAQAAQVTGPRMQQEPGFDRLELVVVTVDPRRDDGPGRAGRDLPGPPRPPRLAQQLGHLTAFDRGPRVAFTHPGPVAQERRGGRRAIHRTDPAGVGGPGQAGEVGLLAIHLPAPRE